MRGGWTLRRGVWLGVVLVLALLTTSPAGALGLAPDVRGQAVAFPPKQWTPLYPSPADRLGYGVARGIEHTPPGVLEQLRAGWYVNWGASPAAPHPAALRYVQIIRLTPDGYQPNGDELLDIIRRNPGTLWLIGNEPDSPYQDNQTPDEYVVKYHELYHLIKQADPSALVAIGGVVQPTPVRLQYLDMIWDGYRARYGTDMPVDVWNVHNFILREAGPDCPAGGVWGAFIPPGISQPCGRLYTLNDHDNMDIFRQQIRDFRAWMKAKGQQDKPLIVSEYGILFPEELGFGADRVRNFMLATFDFFMNARDPDLGYPADDYHLVQQWAWFSLDVTSFEWGHTYSALYDRDQGALTSLGQAFVSYAQAHDHPYHDLRPAAVTLSADTAIPFGGEGQVRVAVSVVNEGNVAGAGNVSLERRHGSGWQSLGARQVDAVPRRFEAARTVHFTDRISSRAAVTYRARVTSPGDARAANDVQQFTMGWDVALASVIAGTGFSSDPARARVQARVVVSNTTSVPLAHVPVRVVDAGDGARVWAEGSVAEVPARGVGEVVLTWEMPVGHHHLRALVDPDDRVQETDEGNNARAFDVWVLPYRAALPTVLRRAR